MYRIFVGGKYIGDYSSFPFQGGKTYYLYNKDIDKWHVRTSTNWYGVKPAQVPKEYRALNLLL